MRVGIYNRHWNTLGGGEKYSGALAQRLSENHEVELIGIEPVDLLRLQKVLNVELTKTTFVEWPYFSCADLSDRTKHYDLFINASYYSNLASQAKTSAYIVYFPQKTLPHWVCKLGMTICSIAKALHLPRAHHYYFKFKERDDQFLNSYQTLIAISEYTEHWLRKRWRRKSVALTPPADIECFRLEPDQSKKKIILSVGRFFDGGHNKKHLEMIKTFRRMVDENLIPADWEYHIAGNVHRNSELHNNYFKRVVELAEGYPIVVHADLPFDDLKSAYKAAAIFWHASGWGESEKLNPELFEHFGITTCEALSAGCVPVVIARAGQLEIVQSGLNGYLFTNQQELIDATRAIIEIFGTPEWHALAVRCACSAMKFSRANFNKTVDAIFESEPENNYDR